MAAHISTYYFFAQNSINNFHSLSARNILLLKYYVLTTLLSKNEPPRDKTSKLIVGPAKTQSSLGIRPVWSESSLCAQWVAKDTSYLHADSEDSDQTGRMPKLIWVFAGRTVTLWFCHKAAKMFLFPPISIYFLLFIMIYRQSHLGT